MKVKKILSCLIALPIFLCAPACHAEENTISFNKDDRVLILVPHPDDEAIGTAGVIQKALKAGSKVKVVLFTNGDHNELSFIIYEKRLTFRKGELLHMGEVRANEVIAAMASLGVSRDNIIFLGYPDFETMEILTKYWGNAKPFMSLLTRMHKASYPEAMSPGAPYTGESILKDIKNIILDFRPTKIFVSHPADTNRDHRALYLFLKVCLWDLEGKIKKPDVFACLIHVIGWPKPRGYNPGLELNPPDKLNDDEILWEKIELTKDEIEAKYNAISFYKSQIKCDPPYLFTFARKNELFGDLPTVKLKNQSAEEIYRRNLANQDIIQTLTYTKENDNLIVKLALGRKIDKELGVSVFLLGYNKNVDFAKMPKINISVNIFGLRIKDKKQKLLSRNVKLDKRGKSLTVKIPLAILGNPYYILCCTKAHSSNFSLEETAWRILELE